VRDEKYEEENHSKCSKLLNGQSSLERIRTHLNTENTRAILPIARILFLMTSLRKLAALPARQPG
jgi:hypothetical protein